MWRFTPTCVGKTRWAVQERSGSQVHPHVCGENLVNYFTNTCEFGSPPRVWGKLLNFAP